MDSENESWEDECGGGDDDGDDEDDESEGGGACRMSKRVELLKMNEVSMSKWEW